MLRDPGVRRTFLLTKLGAFAVAAVATWPLSKVIGEKAWWVLGIFGAVLVALTALELLLSSGGSPGDTDADASDPESEYQDPERPMMLPVEDSLDLHPFAPRDIAEVVVDYLDAAHELGHREVRLIHGRGIGVQRDRVRQVLGAHPLVHQYRDAPPGRGGWGATVAYLKDEPSDYSDRCDEGGDRPARENSDQRL